MVHDDQRGRVVAAAATILAERGAAALTTRAVAEAAGVQAPTLYRLFGDKDGLVDAVAEHQMAAYVAAQVRDVAGNVGGGGEDDVAGDPVEELRRAWGQHVAFGLAHPDLYAMISSPARSGSAATRAGLEVLGERVRRVAAAGQLAVDEDRAVAMIHAAGTGAVLTLLALPVERRDPGLSDAVRDAVLAAVVTGDPVLADPTPTALAVAFATTVPELPALSDAERTLLGEWVARSVAALRDA